MLKYDSNYLAAVRKKNEKYYAKLYGNRYFYCYKQIYIYYIHIKLSLSLCNERDKYDMERE